MVLVRDSTLSDIQRIHDIYAHYVVHSTASFEEAPPTLDDIRGRRDAVHHLNLPHLVAEVDGRVLGYAFASSFRARPAYRFTIENSVYVDQAAVRSGIGRALMTELLARCERGTWQQMIAVIGDSQNAASIRLHESLGFTHAGILYDIGFKFNRWIDVVLMQRALHQT
jgi:L-amino acid N-acyltransferase YncA